MTTVAVSGLGNIGSHLVSMLGHMGISSVLLIDGDVYERKNLKGQNIMESFVGKPKAAAQAERLLSLNPNLRVEAIDDVVENVPWGRLKGCTAILGCFDNNSARQVAAELCWRLGIPYLDAGVRKENLLVRVDVYIPGKKAPCIECAWTQADYNRLEVHYPCNKKNGRKPAATDSPSYLGSLAASLQAAEYAKILSGNYTAAGSRIVVSAHLYKCYLSRLPVNENCRFDHRTWNNDKLTYFPDTISVQQLLDSGNSDILSASSFGFASRTAWSHCREGEK